MKIKTTQTVVILVVFLLSLFGSIDAQQSDENQNTKYGDYAGASLTTGAQNTFIGWSAGRATTTGNYNTFIGLSAGKKNISSSNNTFLGWCAGFANTGGVANTFLGRSAGHNNNTGNYNTFVGKEAGFKNTTGEYNTFVGYSSGYKNTTANNNTFLGWNAGYENTTGASNTFLGVYAGKCNTTGHYNTFVGEQAGKLNETGTKNTFLGTFAGWNNKTGSGNVFIGNGAGYYETGSNKLYIANDPVDSNVLIYGDFSSRKLGIHMTDLSYELDVAGTVCADEFIVRSDLRLKKDVKPIEKALDKITNLRGVNFHWKDKEKDSRLQLGVIAQEVEKVFPEVVSTDDKGYKSVAYSNLVAPLIEAVKELKAENETLKKRITALEKKIKN